MRRIITISLLLIASLLQAQSPVYIPQLRVETINQLKTYAGVNASTQIVLGKDSMRDGRGGIYFWDSLSTVTPDDFNIVQVTGTATGRWIRSTQTQFQYPGGYLFRFGMLKFYYGTLATNSSGEATIQATLDGTSTGTAIFSMDPVCLGQIVKSGTDGVKTKVQSISANKKTIVLQFQYESLLGIIQLTPNNSAGSFLFIGM